MPTYIVQKKVVADSVQEALTKERETHVTSVFPDKDGDDKRLSDVIGFKHIPTKPRYRLPLK
jgi:hypothetical protein